MKFFKFFPTCTFCPMMCIVSEDKNIFLDISYEITVIFLLKICKLCVVAASPHGKPFFFVRLACFSISMSCLEFSLLCTYLSSTNTERVTKTCFTGVIILAVKSSAYSTSYVAWYSKVTELKLVYDSD